jgi:hypothetical protein
MSRAFLIGAGATQAQYKHAPLCKNFFQKMKDLIPDHFSTMNKAIGSYIPSKLEKSNVEDVMKLVSNIQSSNRVAFLYSLHLAISMLLAPETKSNRDYMLDYINGEITSPPTHFRTLLATGELNKDDFFLTLNYDLYLDREILYELDKINYGFLKDNIERSEMKYRYENELSVYHLHGALNWEIVGTKIKIHMGAHHPKYRGAGFNLCLIPPGYNKKYSLLDPIWKIAENRLRHANELIIIGCSLNPMDKELIELVKKFVSTKGSQNIKIVYKVDNDVDYYRMDKKYAKIIGNKFKAYRDGFDNKAIDFILNS